MGGTTYEESRSVSLLNASNSGIRFILGGTNILNSKRYVEGGYYSVISINRLWTVTGLSLLYAWQSRNSYNSKSWLSLLLEHIARMSTGHRISRNLAF